MANHTIVDWGPHGIWLSNCSNDIKNTVYDYVTQITYKVTNTTMEHYHDRRLLGWLGCGMAPPRPQIVLDKQIGLKQWDIWKLAASTEELGTWTRHFSFFFFGLDISQGPIIAIAIISFAIINHILYKPMFHFLLLLTIGNLQFNKTLCSVTCINCKLYTCLNSSISLRNDSLLILRSQHNLWLPINLQRP